jgi:cell division protein FtsQ
MKFKKYIPYVLWSLLGCAVLISVAFVSVKQSEVYCTGLAISIDDDNGNYFIENEDVLQLLNSKDKQPVGKRLDEINTALLENIINSNPYVANAEVFSTIDGKLHINIKQRNPIIQILNSEGENFYIDEDAYLMPVSEIYTPDVIVANGNISDRYTRRRIESKEFVPNDSINKSLVLEQLFSIAKYLQTDSVANALFTQIYVNDKNELELVPRIGDHIILIGDAGNFQKKVEMLLVLYRKGLNKKGWTQYSSINLKFENQVVCTKKTKEVKVDIPTVIVTDTTSTIN